jgi:hypothetical protein
MLDSKDIQKITELLATKSAVHTVKEGLENIQDTLDLVLARRENGDEDLVDWKKISKQYT